mgnify:CR=1 FL=1
MVQNISQLNETLSTQHTKIYLTDDRLILSGANLEKSYFTNRQDRYIEFSNSNLAQYFSHVAALIAEYSYELITVKSTLGSMIQINDFHQKKFENFSQNFTNLLKSAQNGTSDSADAIFYPTAQAGFANLTWELDAIVESISRFVLIKTFI